MNRDSNPIIPISEMSEKLGVDIANYVLIYVDTNGEISLASTQMDIYHIIGMLEFAKSMVVINEITDVEVANKEDEDGF